MKRFYCILLQTLLVSITLTAGVREDFKANPKLSANNYQAYPTTGFPAITAAPEGYEPFFINHYGRHGSRWLINNNKYAYPLQMLEKGERYGKLTRRGQEVLDTLRMVYAASRGRLGELSDIGHEQHQGIARRMYQNFPQVFQDEAPVVARSTVVIRCILSMQNEVDVLASLNPRLRITTDASEATMYYMNYSDSVVRPLRKSMSDRVEQCYNNWINPKGMLKKLFNDQKFARDSIDDARKMMSYLFEVGGNMQSHHQFENVNWYDLFSANDIYSVWRYYNVYWYILSGETPLTQCRVDYMEANLLRNFIEDADKAITSDNRTPGASLRFGHESVVLPLCCLMGLNGADYHTTDLETLDQHWQTYKIFPMAANIQFVYFRKYNSGDPVDDILVLPLLNEREATLPVATDVAPYYHWNDVRDYFIDKLSRQPIIDLTK
ncbi:MAG: histidine-type phosphatase [Muribaculaceae bacterium]|nr:histidine-type phosphatase [Muribaculaceae bacterium]